MATANLLRRSDDIDLARLVLILSETVKRIEDKVDMLIIQRADERLHRVNPRRASTN